MKVHRYIRLVPTPATALILVLILLAGCDRPDPRPRQPIAFSHKVHVGDNSIDCQFCHAGVRKGTAAGIPSVERCMGCHQLVAATRPEIAVLRDYYDKRQPIPWMRVNTLADFVFFNHQPHIARGIPCQKCHGSVHLMNEVWPVVNLADMAWCVDCHRQNGGPVDCVSACHR